MSPEMKLLTALCDALGFEVMAEIDHDERKEQETFAMEINSFHYNGPRVLVAEGPHNRLVIDGDGHYTSRLKIPIVSYTLKSKEK